MANPTQPREELVEKLTAVFRRHGYEGATIALLSEASGLSKASLYYQFPRGKEDMAEAVMQSLHAQQRDLVFAPLGQEGSPHQRLARMAEGLATFYQSGHSACIIDVFGIGFSGELFRPRLVKSILGLNAAIATVLEDAGLDAGDAARRAEDALISIQGALVISRATGSAAAFQRIISQLPDQLLGQAPGEPKQPSGT
jgi:TetR/AcrR family transcriptional repressor of lmrAB and yxaGH operons